MKKVVTSIVFLSVGLLAAGCGSASGEASQAGEVKIGTPNPLSGAGAIYGEEAKQGATLAVKEINARDGKCVNNMPATLVAEDDKASPEAAVTAVQKLMTREQVNGIVGGASSAAVLAATQLTKDQLVHINTTAQADEITEKGGSMLFQINITTSQYIEFFNSYIADKVKPQSVVYMAEDSVYNAGVLKLLQAGMDKAGIRLADTALYQSDTNDFTSILNRLKATGTDTLIIADGGPARMSTLMQQVRQVGGFKNVLVAPGVVSQNVIDATGKAMDGVITGDVYSSTLDTKANKDFIAAMKAEHPGVAITKVQELNYEGIYALCGAMTAAGTATDQTAIAEAMRKLSLDTPRGTVTFGDKGRAKAPGFFIQEIRDGKLAVIDQIG
jgi:branched-chain amino acid transport system substrate-binding protein